MSEKFLSYLRQKGISLNAIPDVDSNTSLMGTLVADGFSQDDIKLTLVYQNNKWFLNFLDENQSAVKSLPLPLSKWSYHCTFIQIEPDILFFSNRSDRLVLIAFTIALASRQTKVPYPTKTETDSLFVAMIMDSSLTKIRPLYTEALYYSDMNFVPGQKPLHLYSITREIYSYSYSFLPFIDTGKDQGSDLPPVPCFFPSSLPELIYPVEQEEAIIQGIRALYKRIDAVQSELAVADETPLELTRQKMLLEIEQLQSQIDLKKQNLILEMNKRQNDILDMAMKTVSTTGKLSNRLEFKGKYSLPGKDVADQIMKIASEINA